MYLAVGPVASAAYSEATWDGAFGGELVVARVCEGSPLSAIGLSAGGIRFAQATAGRLWLDLMLGTTELLGSGMGLSGGLAAEVGELQRPRLGWQATLWLYAGVTPYVRVGSVAVSGIFFDAGIKITLPAIRWR